MNKFLFLPVMLLFSMGILAQAPVFTWNLANTKPAKDIDVQLMGYTSQGYYVVNKKPASGMEFSPTITVEYFNSRQERIFVKNITPTPQEDYVNTVYFNNSLYLISALYTKDAGKTILWATPITADGTLAKPVELASMSADTLSQMALD